jgi:NAD(P)-dependent dehydrogenase (short-subunit alcohol dehydrogenase family)
MTSPPPSPGPAADVAILTGAAGGIGGAVAHELARRGFTLALVDRDLDGAQRTAERVRADIPDAVLVIHAADVSAGSAVEEYVSKVVAELGVPRLLVNNAGIEGQVRPIHEYSEAEFDNVWNVNARGTWLNIKHVAPLMLERGGGAIVNIASVAGIRTSLNLAPYVASKHAVVGLTRAAASDLAPGIRVNAVCPGPVDTRMLASLNMQRAGNEDAVDAQRARMAGNVRLGRLADPREIASVVAFLASDDASFMTGAAVVADGGMTI